MKTKEQALTDFIEMTHKSWTYQKMTDSEKEQCDNLFNHCAVQDIQGNYKQRWKAYQAVYYGYLLGLGYTSFDWRE